MPVTATMVPAARIELRRGQRQRRRGFWTRMKTVPARQIADRRSAATTARRLPRPPLDEMRAVRLRARQGGEQIARCRPRGCRQSALQISRQRRRPHDDLQAVSAASCHCGPSGRSPRMSCSPVGRSKRRNAEHRRDALHDARRRPAGVPARGGEPVRFPSACGSSSMINKQ